MDLAEIAAISERVDNPYSAYSSKYLVYVTQVWLRGGACLELRGDGFSLAVRADWEAYCSGEGFKNCHSAAA